jgi:transcriptional regulator with XRE-family HTH domain
MSISNIRNGKTRNPSVYVLKAVADELGTTVDMILKMTEWESMPEIPKRLPAKEA